MKWYALTVHSGQEEKIKKAIEDSLKQDQFEEIFVPTKTENKKTTALYPGYVFVKMNLTANNWHTIKSLPKIRGFVGNQRPQPVPQRQIDEMSGTINPKPQISPQHRFNEGEKVKIIDGAFTNFSGKIESVNFEKKKAKVLISIFGRDTSVELDFNCLVKNA